MTGAQLSWFEVRGSSIPAITGYGVHVQGDVDLRGSAIERLDLFGAHIDGRLWLNGANLGGRRGFALNAPEVVIGGGMYCGGGFMALGGVNLYQATIGSDV